MNTKLRGFIRANIIAFEDLVKDIFDGFGELLYTIMSRLFWIALVVGLFLLVIDGASYIVRGSINPPLLLATEIAGGIVIFCILAMILEAFISTQKDLYKLGKLRYSNSIRIEVGKAYRTSNNFDTGKLEYIGFNHKYPYKDPNTGNRYNKYGVCENNNARNLIEEIKSE